LCEGVGGRDLVGVSVRRDDEILCAEGTEAPPLALCPAWDGLVGMAAAIDEVGDAMLAKERAGEAEDVAALRAVAHDEELRARREALTAEEDARDLGERAGAGDDEVGGGGDARGEARIGWFAGGEAPGGERLVQGAFRGGGRGAGREEALHDID